MSAPNSAPLGGFKVGDKVRATSMSSQVGEIVAIDWAVHPDWSDLAVVEFPLGFTDNPTQRVMLPVAQLVKVRP